VDLSVERLGIRNILGHEEFNLLIVTIIRFELKLFGKDKTLSEQTKQK
jgi:hypothetical protein